MSPMGSVRSPNPDPNWDAGATAVVPIMVGSAPGTAPMSVLVMVMGLRGV